MVTSWCGNAFPVLYERSQWCVALVCPLMLTVCPGAAQIKVNIKAPRHWLLWGESNDERWFSLQKGPATLKCFHLMTSSWYRNVLDSLPNGCRILYSLFGLKCKKILEWINIGFITVHWINEVSKIQSNIRGCFRDTVKYSWISGYIQYVHVEDSLHTAGEAWLLSKCHNFYITRATEFWSHLSTIAKYYLALSWNVYIHIQHKPTHGVSSW